MELFKIRTTRLGVDHAVSMLVTLKVQQGYKRKKPPKTMEAFLFKNDHKWPKTILNQQ